MSTVSYSEGGNVGGILELFMAEYYKFTSLNPVAFKTGQNWTLMEFLPESASCKYNSSEDDNGPIHNYSLVFGFNKQSEVLFNAFKRFIGQTGIVKYTDQNGLTQLLGTLKNRVTLKTEGDTGNNPSDTNYYKLTVTWSNNKPATIL